MPEILDKEAMDFMTRFFGGTASALTQFLLSSVAHKVPGYQGIYTRPDPKLPYWGDIIVGGISVGEALVGLGLEDDPLKVLAGMDYAAKENLKKFGQGLRKFGEGGVLYSVPMLTKETIEVNTPAKTIPPATRGAGSPPPQPVGRLISL